VDEFFADCFLSSRHHSEGRNTGVFSLIVPPTEKSFQLIMICVSSVFFLVKRIILDSLRIECVWRVVVTRLSVWLF
ncbi:hypothetical protein NYV45_24665, partial [Escherichia coli]|nr:hypothetical protein [Escherichia coli]